MAICLEQGADLHMAQLMPLTLTVSCFSKIQIGLTFLVPAHLCSPEKRAVNRVCMCACVCECILLQHAYHVCYLRRHQTASTKGAMPLLNEESIRPTAGVSALSSVLWYRWSGNRNNNWPVKTCAAYSKGCLLKELKKITKQNWENPHSPKMTVKMEVW